MDQMSAEEGAVLFGFQPSISSIALQISTAPKRKKGLMAATSRSIKVF
jgi:hypothetical protein